MGSQNNHIVVNQRLWYDHKILLNSDEYLEFISQIVSGFTIKELIEDSNLSPEAIVNYAVKHIPMIANALRGAKASEHFLHV